MHSPPRLSAALSIVWWLSMVDELAAQTSSAEHMSRAIHLKRVTFHEATVAEALAFLDQKAQEQLELGKTLVLPRHSAAWPSLSSSQENRSLYEILHDLGQRLGLELYTHENALFYAPAGELAPVPDEGRNSERASIYGSAIRYLIRNAGPRPALSYCVLCPERLAAETLAKTFSTHEPLVIAETGSHSSSDERNMYFSLYSPRWLADTAVALRVETPGITIVLGLTHTTEGWFVTQDDASEEIR